MTTLTMTSHPWYRILWEPYVFPPLKAPVYVDGNQSCSCCAYHEHEWLPSPQRREQPQIVPMGT